MDKNATDKLDLAQLRAHMREKPRTKAGQVRQAWPDIKQLLDAGHSLKDVCQWLNEIGLQIGYARLSDYVSQLRRRETVMVTARGGYGTIAVNSDRRRLPRIRSPTSWSGKRSASVLITTPNLILRN